MFDDDRAGQIAADVASLLAVDFVAGRAVVRFGDRHVITPGTDCRTRRHVLARRVDLHVHRFRAAQPRGEVGRRVDGDHAAFVDDDHPVAGLRDFGQDVRAQNDRVRAGQLLDRADASR